MMSVEFNRFPSVKAIQAGRSFYVTALPLPKVSELLVFADPNLPPEERAQRVLNRGRVPSIARYLTANPKTYVLSALTASIDGDVTFEESDSNSGPLGVGELVVPVDARILVNDGQHRREAIAVALVENPDLAYESVPLVLFLDAGLTRSQQMFADLNRHGIRPPRSLNVLYDHRDEFARIARRIAREVAPFEGLTEMEKSSLSNRTSNMFTLSSIHQATRSLFQQFKVATEDDLDEETIVDFWTRVGDLYYDWGFLGGGRTAAELRAEYIHPHAVALQSIGMAGGQLLGIDPENWPSKVEMLRDVDWSRTNPQWDGRAIRNERISKAGTSLVLTSNVLKRRMGIDLSAGDLALERTLDRSNVNE